MQFMEGIEGHFVDRLRVAAVRYTSLPARTVKKKEREVGQSRLVAFLNA